jgi:hypothetical protein
MRKTLSLCLTLAILTASCFVRQKGMDKLFPSSGFEKGWKWEGKPKHYFPQNLYEYIDGEAELYISYGFKELATLLYYWGSPEDTFFVVDIYDMGSPLNAFGLYSNFRHPEYQFHDIGAEGFVSAYGMKFYKGNYLVDIKVGDFSEKCRRAVWIAAKEVDRRIETPTQGPDYLDYLPAENQMPRTLRYIQREMLNQGFLPGGLEARYAVEGGEVTGFVVVFDSLLSAKQGFEELKQFHAVSGGRFINAKVPGESSFAVRTSYHGVALVFLTGKCIGGVQDLSDATKGEGLVNALFENITNHSNKTARQKN